VYVSKAATLQSDLVQLARIALTGRTQDVQLLLHRFVKRYRSAEAQTAEALAELLRESPTRASPLRKQSEVPLPVDVDSRLHLLRVEDPPTLDHDPIFAPVIEKGLGQIVAERARPEQLFAAGLQPTKSVLFTGLPGVGKTMGARWLAVQLGRPLLTLDLAAVMSSYLGRTGGNLRHVLDYAKSTDCVLLLDELDALAKRRDDRGEIGELKRLVTVLIQEIDDWPSSGLLIAATNHPELLDPAIWRRFEMVVEFPLPDRAAMAQFLKSLIDGYVERPAGWAEILGLCFSGRSFSDVERDILAARRSAVLGGRRLDETLGELVLVGSMAKSDRIDLAVSLVENGVATQRRAHELTGVARETIRSRVNADIAEAAE
jgi:SpoVK/Ycf46/Vps4 family AAA+-type ATPase